jgi:four helix bundle protein
MSRPHIIRDRAFDFAIRVVNLYKHLQIDKREFVLSKQLLRCGTSIGANLHEAEHAQSKADFISKMSISLKEAAETQYWLRLLHKTDYLSDKEFQSMYDDCNQLTAIIAAATKTLKDDQ